MVLISKLIHISYDISGVLLKKKITWNNIPTNNIPINLGNVVSDINHPPKFAATVKTTNWKSCPPGAAESPNMAYAVTHVRTP